MISSDQYDGEIGKRLNVGRNVYVIEKVLAEGGFGLVFLVRDFYGKLYALKRILVNDEAKLKDCRTEIDILSSLSGYKNIIKFTDSSIVRRYDGVWEVYIITEYYPGSCVRLIERKKVLSESEVLRIYCDISEAVAILHHCQIPIIHRDVKVENILIDKQNNFVLCDFGSATSSSYSKTHANFRELEEDFNRHTTRSHRAPEIVDFYSSQEISTKVDIWALGVTLYRLCFNTLPFGESGLSSQSGHFTIPENSPYSEQLHALIYYHFEVNPSRRPDIYQVASIAFLLAKKPCPVSNMNNVTVPSLMDLVSSMNSKQSSSTNTKKYISKPNPSISKAEWVETTTILPRERPKAGKALQKSQSTKPATQTETKAIPSQNLATEDLLGLDFESTMPKISPLVHQHISKSNIDLKTIPSTDIFGLNAQPAVMSKSLESSRDVSGCNPFGDDFSKLDLNQIYFNPRQPGICAGQASNTQETTSAFDRSLHKQQIHPRSISNNINIGSQGHSDAVCSVSGQNHSWVSSNVSTANGFDDDFSTLSSLPQAEVNSHVSVHVYPPITTKPVQSVQGDLFGFEPFNPTQTVRSKPTGQIDPFLFEFS